MGKKALIITATLIAAALLAYFVGTGFRKDSSVCILDCSISEDGRSITINAGIPVSMGYIREAAVHRQAGGRLNVDFYSAFGGLNGCIGAKTSFTLPLDEDTTVIAVYRGPDCYQEALYKDDDGKWQFVR